MKTEASTILFLPLQINDRCILLVKPERHGTQVPAAATPVVQANQTDLVSEMCGHLFPWSGLHQDPAMHAEIMPACFIFSVVPWNRSSTC